MGKVEAGGVFACSGKRRGVLVVAPDFEVKAVQAEFAPRGGFFEQTFPHGGFVALPVGEAETLPFQGGGDVCRHEQGFEEDGAAAAERVDKVVALGGELWPASAVQQGRGEVFF